MDVLKHPHGGPRRLLRWVQIALIGLATVPAVPAAEPDLDLLKVGFIYNFTKFTEWPESRFAAAADPLKICATDRAPLGGHLAKLELRLSQGRPIRVLTGLRLEELAGCHVVVVTASEASLVGGMLEAVQGSPVLTVSDVRDSARRGVMIELVRSEDRFALRVNAAAARRARLVLSAQLLQLAKEVL